MTTTTTTTAVEIPAAEPATGFVAVAVRFPHDPTAHRLTRDYSRPDGTPMGMPTRWDDQTGFRIHIRAACRPDDTQTRHYELSIPTALARGAVACGAPECFGGAA
jgi:hypothetical protein